MRLYKYSVYIPFFIEDTAFIDGTILYLSEPVEINHYPHTGTIIKMFDHTGKLIGQMQYEEAEKLKDGYLFMESHD